MRFRYGWSWLAAILVTGWLFACWPAFFPGGDAGFASSAAAQEVSEESGDAAAAGSEETDDDAPAEESLLVWLYHSLKLRYTIIFLVITFNLVALMVMNVLSCRRDALLPPALIQSFEQDLNEKRYQEAYEKAKNDGSMLGQILSAGMAKLSGGYEPAVQAMQEVGEEENLRLDQRLSYIALIGQISPMFGLLGTVDGMVQAFNQIAKSNTTPKPSKLANGIGTALVTTLVGLTIAIIAIGFHHFIRNRITKLVMEVGVISEELMRRFANVGPTKKT
ncbi:MAG: MotA/TolQ/ExbB proton channel family protein [Pirellulales bacterium]|nr:MotA/TolQ/ExbB proton channel family protein [Pirellulales bacterium]